ncbi:MAG: hypothetical protein ACFFFK_12275 [Candidatus Thorarchaeota archaeon]
MSKTEFLPGNDIAGAVAVSCDNNFKSNRLRILIVGQLSVKSKSIGTVGKGMIPVSYDTITKTSSFYQDEVVIAEKPSFDPGTQKFPFQFTIPEDAELSYEGHNVEISYEITAVLDLPWRKTISDRSRLVILEYIDDFPDEVTREVLNFEGKEILEIEIDSQKYCIGNKISFKYRINTDMKFDSLRARIEHTEQSSIFEKHTEVLWEESIPSETIIHDQWQSWTFNINKLFPPWVKSDLLLSTLNLTVTIRRRMGFDKSVKIELFSGLCSKYRRGWTYAK